MAPSISSSADSLFVASIDFGTTYSGWAYSLKTEFMSQPTKIQCRTWHSGSDLLTEKTPTVLLIKPDGKTLEAFGYEAENKYQQLTVQQKHKDYYYFRNFKMALYTSLTQRIDRNFLLEDEMEKTLPALDVFSITIKFLVEDFFNFVSKTLASDISQSDVHWVLTIPAIWTDQAKHFMREACEKAGIERYKLSIALEPEAASAYCRYLPMDKATDVSLSSLPIGTKYMILDAGGGTVDITVHEVTDKLSVKEVVAASGGGWGSTLVNKEFENLVEDLVGKEVYRLFKIEQTEDWLSLIRDFEVKKKTVHPKKDVIITMKIPSSLVKMSKEKHGYELAKYIQESCSFAKDVKLQPGKIKFSSCVFRRLFEKSCTKVVQHVRSVISDTKLGDLNMILMVGGYSASSMLQHAVTEAFPERKVVIRPEACSAIIKGAVVCGHRPEFMTERVLKYTYGVDAMIPFIEGKHAEKRRIKTDYGFQCRDAFDRHVEKGQIVRVGEAQCSRTYVPSFQNQDKLLFNVYASELRNPEFVDEGCTLIGCLSVDIIPGDLTNEIKINFTFSGTEIEVDVICKNTGEKNKHFIRSSADP